jgi:hypothetical protein
MSSNVRRWVKRVAPCVAVAVLLVAYRRQMQVVLTPGPDSIVTMDGCGLPSGPADGIVEFSAPFIKSKTQPLRTFTVVQHGTTLLVHSDIFEVTRVHSAAIRWFEQARPAMATLAVPCSSACSEYLAGARAAEMVGLHNRFHSGVFKCDGRVRGWYVQRGDGASMAVTIINDSQTAGVVVKCEAQVLPRVVELVREHLIWSDRPRERR